MYCNFTKCHAIPTAIRASSQQPKHLLQLYINPKPSQLLPSSNWGKPICCSRVRRFRTSSIGFLGSVNVNHSNGICLKLRTFSTSSYVRKAVEGRNKDNEVKSLPWLARNKKDSEVNDPERSSQRFTKDGREKIRRKDFKQRSKGLEDELTTRKVNRSSWEESAENFVRNGVQREDELTTRKVNRPSWEESAEKFVRNGVQRGDELTPRKVNRSSWEGSAKKFVRKGVQREDELTTRKVNRPSWEESAEKFGRNGVQREDELTPRKVNQSSWEESADKFVRNGVQREDELTPRKVNRTSWEESAEKFGRNGVESKEKGRRFNERSGYKERRNVSDDESDIESEESENPKWYKVQERFDRFDKMAGVERNDRFNRQDNWGKKVWKEASESSVPKMIGECVYGVGPVLAALSANRREFYVLYVQEGIDLSGNNKKKKDKKAFEKVLKLADEIGLTKKEVSKHDLNMIADNRPHQGLVLDASPLEMVNIRELDRVAETEKAGLWLALDEVMDPQNLGAIIRSAYFFGASGVVLCAKNSAPLSGVVSKASAGSLELTELRSCKNMMQFLISSAENGWRVLGGSVSSRAVDINEVITGEPTILVLGSEGTGLRTLVERSCTQLVKIAGNIPVHLSAGLEEVEPQSFVAVESLNVSVAAGVLLHHLAGNKTAVE